MSQPKHVGPWERMFRALKMFQRTHGHCDVPPNRHPDSLYAWQKKQRQRHAASGLHFKQLKKLRSIGALQKLTGAAEYFNEMWEESFERLQRFQKRFGHCNVPARWQEDEKLGAWVYTQRAQYKKGRLQPERVKRLEKLGIAWRLGLEDKKFISSGSHYQRHEKSWDRFFKKIQKWKKNSFFVPDGVDETLRRWTITQRTYHRKGTLRPDRERRLERIGFPWKLQDRLDEAWEGMFQKLVAFKKRFGHPNVPVTRTGDEKLAGWVANQREFYKDGLLSRERVEKLEKIGFCWRRPDLVKMRLAGTHYKEHEALWERRFQALRKWKHKDYMVTVRDDFSLFRWLTRQRAIYRAGLMRADRKRRLEQIGFSMEAPDPTDKKWEAKFKQLVAHKKRFGHFNVPTKRNQHLNAWVRRQRERQKLGRLRKDRRKRLEAIGFAWV
jgi:hypothetical protein